MIVRGYPSRSAASSSCGAVDFVVAVAVMRMRKRCRALSPSAHQRSDDKQLYRFRRKDLEPFAFAGIWEFARLKGERSYLRQRLSVNRTLSWGCA